MYNCFVDMDISINWALAVCSHSLCAFKKVDETSALVRANMVQDKLKLKTKTRRQI